VNLLRYANVLLLRAKARAGKVSYLLHATVHRSHFKVDFLYALLR
jgi:hypothetical protein